MKNDINTDKPDIKEIFNSITRTYDLLNHVLSFGLDVLWRRKVALMTTKLNAKKLVDIAAGSGDMMLMAAKYNGKLNEIVGIDISPDMLAAAKKKLPNSSKFKLINSPAENIPFEDEYFDAATIAFGIRNFADIQNALAEIKRVLRPGGMIFILEFSLSQNLFVRVLSVFYLRCFIPFIGGIISGRPAAYKYLSESILSFSKSCDVCRTLACAGFVNVQETPLNFGICRIYSASK